jgi:hypothetical protein
MNSNRPTFYRFHHLGEVATHPIARPAGRLAALLLLVGAAPRRRRAPSTELRTGLPSGPPAAYENGYFGAVDRRTSSIGHKTGKTSISITKHKKRFECIDPNPTD